MGEARLLSERYEEDARIRVEVLRGGADEEVFEVVLGDVRGC